MSSYIYVSSLLSDKEANKINICYEGGVYLNFVSQAYMQRCCVHQTIFIA